ncbi:MAG: prepilin-type N-terminal cleavage/methylation domain-containing protein [Microgenomates group bacterium]
MSIRSALLSIRSAAKNAAGFTMIELLIVIAILGILAVAVLSALNPIEQINRGRDTGYRSDAEQLLNAFERYQAFQGAYPWQTGPGDTSNIGLSWQVFDDSVADTATPPCPVYEKLSEATTANCIGTDEVKVSFFNRVFAASRNPLYVYNDGTQGASTYVCFAPSSQAFITEVQQRLDPDLNGVLDNFPADYPDTWAIGNTTECGVEGNCVCIP